MVVHEFDYINSPLITTKFITHVANQSFSTMELTANHEIFYKPELVIIWYFNIFDIFDI